MTDSDGRGISIADLWGPNKKKGCTILVKKSKEHDEKFVNILAKQFIQPLLDCIISGRNLENLLNGVGKKKNSVVNKWTQMRKYTFYHQIL